MLDTFIVMNGKKGKITLNECEYINILQILKKRHHSLYLKLKQIYKGDD